MVPPTSQVQSFSRKVGLKRHFLGSTAVRCTLHVRRVAGSNLDETNKSTFRNVVCLTFTDKISLIISNVNLKNNIQI